MVTKFGKSAFGVVGDYEDSDKTDAQRLRYFLMRCIPVFYNLSVMRLLDTPQHRRRYADHSVDYLLIFELI